jgi:hypothetical protein
MKIIDTKEVDYRYSFLVLMLSMLACGGISLFFGKELCWDLANYHYYNPYAFFHSRWSIDYWPSSFIQVNLAPTIDFLSFFLIDNFSAKQTVFILGAIHGINFWLLFLIANFFQNTLKLIITSPLLAILLAGLGLYGPTAWPGIGSFQNDDLISIFILSAFLLQSKGIQSFSLMGRLPVTKVVWSGLLLGISAGLKLTAASFIVGTFIALIILPIRLVDKITLLFVWGAGVTAGFIGSSGYWMLILWQRYHNPFFPFFNGIFHSSGFPAVNFHYETFLPQSILERLFYPFFPLRDGDIKFTDLRYPLIYVFLVIAGCFWLVKKIRHAKVNEKNLLIAWLYGFFIFSYLVWEYYFSIARYLVVIEMLAPLIIFVLINRVIPKQSALAFTVLFASFAILIVTFSPIEMIRAHWYEGSFFNVQTPEFVKQTPRAIVFMAYPEYALERDPRPQTYLVPFFPREWIFVGIPFSRNKFSSLSAIDYEKINSRLVANKKNPFYLLTAGKSMPQLYLAAKNFGFVTNGNCEKILSDRQRISNEDVLICPISKVD